MQIKEIRTWLNLNLDGKHHSTLIEKRFKTPIDPEEVTDALIIDLIREARNFDITGKVLEIRNFISHEVKYKEHDALLQEARYNATLDPDKLSAEETALFLLLVYGIKTKKAKPSDMSWDAEAEEPQSFDPLAYGFPEKMLAYLAKPENLYKRISGATDAPTLVELRSSGNLKLIDIEFEASEAHIRISDKNLLADPNYDPENDSDKYYKTTAIDLIRRNDLYESKGLLIWIPALKAFGAYDEEHQDLIVFPDAKPADIQKDLGTYLEAQWSCGKNSIVKSGNVYDYYEPWKHFTFE